MALVELRGNLDPFRASLKRLEDVGFSSLEVSAPGQDAKVKAAIDRGDKIPARPVHAALQEGLEASWGEGMTAARVRQAVERAVAEGIRDVILGGYVQGPPRKTKRGKKLYDSGDLARGVRAKAVR